MSGFAEERFIPLIRGFGEVVDRGRLAGDFEAYRLATYASLIPVWEEVAPAQRLVTIEQAPEIARSIVFDVDGSSRAVLRLLRAERPPGMVISFFEEYLPSLMARTFSPYETCSLNDIGPGLIIFHTPRTGSHFLASMITALGSFGVTEQWLRPTVVEAVRLGIIRLTDHLRRCAGFQRATARTWSAVLELPHLEDIWPHLDDEDRSNFKGFLSEAHLVLLTRIDKPAQIWSTVRAVQSRKFVMTSQDQQEDSGHIDPSAADMYWLWMAFTAGKLRQWEDLAEALARNAGNSLERVSYEELRDSPISDSVHRRVFGRFYKEDYVLNPSASWYRKQSTACDLDQVERLAVTYRSIREIDLHDMACRHYRFDMWGRKARETAEGAIVDFERVDYTIIAFMPTCKDVLVVEFSVSATDVGALQCRASRDDCSVLAGELAAEGAYVLVVSCSQSEKCELKLTIECASRNKSDQPGDCSFQITRAYSVEADATNTAHFNWLTLVAAGDTSTLYRCIQPT